MSVATSFRTETSIWQGGPVSSSRAAPWAAMSFSATAFLTIRWQAGTLESCDLSERPATGNAAFGAIQRSHGKA